MKLFGSILVWCMLCFYMNANAQNWGWELIPVQDGDEWYYVNEMGQRWSTHSYEDALAFSYIYAAVKVNGKYGVIDRRENIIIEPQYDFIKSHFDTFMVVLSGDTFWVDAENNPDFKRRKVSEYSNRDWQKKIISEGDKMGVLDEYGDTLIEPIYNKAELFKNTYAIIVYNEEGKLGVFNNYGNMIFPPELDSIQLLNSNVIQVYKNGKIGAVDRLGRLLALPKYDELYFDYPRFPYVILEDGRVGYIFKGNEYWK
ncbi:WG repeat-containing protein [bacterium SCSIO 12643]|nr:WG repeat-containing protein [bacterium SCSIO 12643]